MGAYTKEQFEGYRGEDGLVEVLYYSEKDQLLCVAVKHDSYGEYIEFLDTWTDKQKLEG